MNRGILFMAGLALPAILNAQAREWDPEAVTETTNWSEVAAGGGRLFFALIAGILLAMAFQWILTSLSVATGITAMGKASKRIRRSYYPEDRYRDEDAYRKDERRAAERHEDLREERAERERRNPHEPEWEKPAQKIQTGAGLWVLITASISTFLAAWLAAELIRFGGRTEAIIVGLAVWSGFMFTLMWLEATALGSLMGNIMGAFKGGLKAAAAPLKTAAGSLGTAASASAEEIAAKVKEEFRAQGGGSGLKEKLKDYVGSMQNRSFDRSRIERDADELYEDADIREAARSAGSLDRKRFQEITAGRSDLAPEEQRTLAEVLHSKWNRLASESKGEAAPAGAYAGAAGLETRGRESIVPDYAESPSVAGEAPSVPIRSESKTYSSSPYAGASSPYASASSGTRTASPAFPARFQAFKDFLRGADKRDLNPVRIEQEVETLVLHPEEGYANMERSVREVKRDEVSQVLRQRRDITLEEADSIADLVDAARTRMLSRSEIREHRVQETTDRALSRVRDYVYSLKRPELDYDGFKGDFQKLLEDPKAGLESLKARATSGIDRESLIQTFSAKSGISRQEAEKMADQAEHALKQAEENARRVEEETRRRLDQAKRVAAENAESTRKLAASAAWWLFAVAVVTAGAAILGGLTGANT